MSSGRAGRPRLATPGLPGGICLPRPVAAASSFAEFLAAHAPELLPGSRRHRRHGGAATRSAPHGTTIVAADLRRRRRHGRRPPRHHGQPHRPARHREGVPGRRLLVRRHRGHRRASPSSWSGCSRSSSSTTRRSRASSSRSTARPTGSRRCSAATSGWRCRAWPSSRCSPATTSTPSSGRIFSYDVTGGRYEEHAYHSVGSGSMFATRRAQEALPPGPDARPTPSRVALQALYDAADDDSATGGPDVARRIFPVVARGRRRRATAASRDDELGRVVDARSSGGCAARRPDGPTAAAVHDRGADAVSMPFYVSPEQIIKDKADYARKGIARGRSVVVVAVRRRHRCSSPRTLRARCTRSARSTTASRSPRSASTTSSRTCASPASGSPTCAATPTTGATSPARASPTPTRRRSARSSPSAPKPYEVEIVVAEVGDDTRRATRSTGSPSTARSPTSTASSAMGGPPRRSRRA